jgi:LAO/AO transport system kinase
VIAASARTGEGVAALWELVLAHRSALQATGELQARRQMQARDWMWSLVQEGLERAFRAHPAVARRIPSLEREVEAHRATPAAAARALLEAFEKGR